MQVLTQVASQSIFIKMCPISKDVQNKVSSVNFFVIWKKLFDIEQKVCLHRF